MILATGGARGITAEICRELAERYQPTLVLVGQTPLPDLPEQPDTADFVAPADVKRALMARLGRDGTKVTAPLVERAFHLLMRSGRSARTSASSPRQGPACTTSRSTCATMMRSRRWWRTSTRRTGGSTV